MKSFILAICLSVGLASAAHADPGKCQSTTNPKCLNPAPAPEIGAGIPSAIAIGGILIGATLLTRLRRT